MPRTLSRSVVIFATARARSAAVRRANSLSVGARLCRAERGFLCAKADDVGGNAKHALQTLTGSQADG